MEPRGRSRRRRRPTPALAAAAAVLTSASGGAGAFPPTLLFDGAAVGGAGPVRGAGVPRRRRAGGAGRRPDLSLSVRGGASSPPDAGGAAGGGGEPRRCGDAGRTSRFVRVASELARHVWPEMPPVPPPEERSESADVATSDSARQLQRLELEAERRLALSIRLRVVASVLLMLLGKAATVCTPFVFKALVDASSGGGAPPSAPAGILARLPASPPVALLAAYGALRSLSSLLREGTNAVFAGVAQGAVRRFGRSTFDHVHSLDLEYHLNRNTGALARVLERGSRSISFALNAMVFNTIPTLVEVCVVMGIMLRKFGPLEATTVMLTIVLYSAYTILVTSWRSSIRKDMIALDGKAAGKVSDSLLNYETVKYFGNEGHEGRAYEGTLLGYQSHALRAARGLSALNFGQNAIFSLGLSVVMYLTLRGVRGGEATVGDLVLVNGLLFQLSVPLNFIGWVYQEVRQALVDMEAMFELRDTRPGLVDAPGAVPFDPERDGTTIEFEGLEFGYRTSPPTIGEDGKSKGAASAVEAASAGSATGREARRPILKETTFTIPRGKTVAIVGSSGSGKSTLLRLLYRFYAPDGGTIRLGGRDISSYTIDSVRRAMAVVPQDVVLFNDSIGYNLRYGNFDATWDEVVEASRKARLHDMIMRLPDGYNTVVGERGLKMSGGEKQRVSLARAILKGAPVLLCDEPTSSLDSRTELEIMANLKEVGRDGGTTCVIIAHRLSTVQDCDSIVVVDAGRVIESGTHDELMRLGGRYSELVAFQRSHGSSSNDGSDINESDQTLSS